MPPSSSPPSSRARPPSWADDERAFHDAGDGAAAPALPLLLEVGTVLARKYELLRLAGFGGMAQLWVAKNRATGAEVCIKVLVPEGTDDELVVRFRREAYAAARLSHRAIVRIFDLLELGETGETTKGKPAALAIVMELLRGETLGDVLMKRGKLPLEEAIDIAVPLVSALAHAHRAEVVHRDLKPDNIFLAKDPDGHVTPKVLDFGVSKMLSLGGKALTLDGVMLGTPSFMSPEQAKGARDVDARSDVFSAGILMYMMIAGENPFESETFHSVVSAIVNREPPRLESVPDPIWNVIEKALAKDPSARFNDATELGIALRHASGRAPITESGRHSVPSFPTSARKLVPALGGDSHVSVPPVSAAESRDSQGGETAHGDAPPAGRRRGVRIVIGVVGASLALVLAALFRPSFGSSSAPSAPAPEATVTAAAKAAPAIKVAPATDAATAERSAASDAGEKAPEATPSAPTEPPAQATSTAASKKRALPAAPLAPPTSKPPKREPSIVRDPGF